MKKINSFSRVNPDGRTTAERRSNDGQSKGRYSVGLAKLLFTLSLLLTLGVGQMWGYTLYLYTGSFTDWENDGAKFQVWTGSKDVNFTSLGNHWYSCTTTDNGTMYFKRRNSDNTSTWNEFNVASISSTNNYVKVTGYSAGSAFTARAITISAGSNGSVSPTSTIAGSSVRSKDNFTATPNTNYAFVNWTLSNNNATINNANSATTYVTTASGACTITANFAPQWNIMGSGTEMGNWATYNQLAYVSSNTFSGTITLAANTTYNFKVYDRRNDAWYGYGSSKGDLSFVGQTAESGALSTGTEDIRIMTAGAGTYTFTWNSSTKKLTVTYPTVTHPSNDYIYYKNTKSWSNVYGYVYGGTTSVWTGPKLSSFTFDGVTYYYAALGDNTNVVFNQGNGTNQDDLTSITGNKGKYYDPSATSWKPFTLTVTLNNKSATSAGTESVTATYKDNTALSSNITCPEKTGYTFGGYYTTDGGSTQIITAAGAWVASVSGYTDASKNWIKNTSTTIFAKWTAKTYTVTFDQQSGSGGSANVTATYGSAMPAATMPTRTGYTFGGYYTEVSGSGTQYYTAGGASARSWNIASATTLYAKWTAHTTTVTIKANGGAQDDQTVTATYGGSIGSFTKVTWSGKGLDGYYTASTGGVKVVDANGNLVANVAGYTDSDGHWILDESTLILHAQWLSNVSVTYYGNGNTGGSVPVDGNSYIPDGAHSATVLGNTGSLTRTGYTWSCWNTLASGLGVDYSAGASINPITSNVSLFAKWTGNNYTVTLNRQGGTTGSTSVTARYGSDMPSTTMPTKSGYDFQGYYASAGGVGTKYYNSDGSSAHVWDVANSTTSIHAHWTIHNYSITYSPSSAPSGCSYSVKPTNADYNTTVNITITPDDAWHHVGVSVAKAGGGSVEVTRVGNVFSFTQPAANVTVTVTVTDLHTGVFMPNAHNEWHTSDPDYEFKKVVGSSPAAATISVDINKADYSSNSYYFGGLNIYNSSSWWKNDGSNFTYMTSHNHTNWSFNTTTGDKSTYVDLPVSGTYTFTLTNYTNTGTQALSVTYPDKSFIEGNFATAWDEDAYPLVEDGNIQSVTIPITSLSDVEFRLVSHGQLWGTSTKILKASNSQTLSGKKMSESGGTMTIGAYVAGDYTFSYNKSTHVLTVTWPVVNQLQIYSSTPSGDAAIGNYNWDSKVGNVYSKTLTLTGGTSYAFKVVKNSDFYGNGGTATRNSSTGSNTLTSLVSPGSNMTIVADYDGSYTFAYDASANSISITYPTAYQITWGMGSVPGNKYTITCKKYGTETAVVSNSTWIKSGDKVTFYAGNNDAANVAKDGYTWRGYYGDAAGATSQLSSLTGYSPVINAADMSFYACFYENDYWITPYINGQGSMSPNGANAHIATATSFTANPGTGYKFDSWEERGGSAMTIATPSAATTNVTTTAAATLQANFSPRWSVIGTGAFGGWSAYDAHLFTSYAVVSTKDVGYNTITLAANTNYEIKVYDRQPGTTYGGSAAQTIDYAHSGAGNEYTIATTASPKSVFIQSAAGGSYTLNWNLTDKKIAVVYPTSWYITTGVNDALGGSFTAVDNSSNNVYGGKFVADDATVTFTATPNTGYNFVGWYSDASCETAYVNGSGGAAISGEGGVVLTLSSITADKTVYAKFTPKTYTITLTRSGDGYGSGGDATATATFNTTLPAVTLPTAANGYAFMGYYSGENGTGTQFMNASGTWATSVTDTITSSKWVLDAGATLYAYFKKAEITSVTFDNAVVEPGATITATANIDPDPAGTTTVCWRLLHDNGNEYTPQPTFTPASGATVSFTVPETSTYYKVEAKLRTGNDCSGGTLLDTKIGRFQVAGSHTVTVYYKNGANVIKASSSVTANPLDWSEEITAPDIFGYTFSSWTAVDGVTIKNGALDPVTTSTNATIQIKATYNGSLTANYTPKNIIYFKDNLEWTDPEDASAHIYLNLLTGDYWNDDNGTGNEGVTNSNLEMSRVPGTTDIFYYDYGNKTTSNYVSFTKESMNGYTHFYQSSGKAHVVFPSRALDALGTNNATGLGFYAATPMFVPLATQTPVQKNSNHAEYCNDGYWTKYLPGTGYSLDIYQSDGSTHVKTIAFTSADELMPMKVTTDLEGGHTYKFQLKRDGDVYYGNSGTMTYEDHGQNTPWDFFHNPFSMCSIVTNAAGNYTFNLSYSPNSGGTQNRLRMSVDYPVADGDYRLLYSDAVQTKPITSAIVNKENNGTAIVSFFVRPGSTPVLRIQQASIDGSTVTWNEYPTSGTPTNQIKGDIATALTSGGTDVYNFNLSMNGSGALSVASVEKYTGNYYIRTDAANSKWDNYRTDPDHRMTYSEYSITHGGYTHYYVHWVNKDDAGRKNVKFCIANDYSPNISDTLAREAASGTWANIDKFIDAGGDLKRSANVRFMWDKRDNSISRAYVDGAQGDYSSNFLYMLNVEAGDDKIKKGDGTALTDHKVTFKDNGNWMYEANVKAQPTAQIKLLSNWGTENTITQYFRGAADATETLLGGSGTNWYDIRVIYDFKTNRLIAGLIPSGEITDPMAIHADVMFIREHHGDIAQLTFTDDGALTDIETAFGVLQLNKWTINNKSKADGHAPLSPLLSQYERDLFYISFPFKVSMEEVFGFGTYGQHWIIEEYDGASRAANGYWQESGPNWKFVFNRKNKFFEPGTGYIIALDLDEMGESADIWANTDQVELYFPSYGTMDNITSSTATYDIPAHLCTINRSNEPKSGGGTLGPDYDRRVKDSHWNVLGVPTYVNPDAPDFANTAWTTTAGETSVGPNFLYEWNMDNNTVTAVSASGYTYQAMHAYLVQYCGDVTWTSSVSVKPSPIVARTYEEAPKSIEFRLELMQDAQAIDQTFVKLSDNEAVTTGFEFNYDLSKEFNKSKSNIYTLIGTEQVAGNVLPLTEQTTVVPVGVIAKTNGDYTFSMPDGTAGIGVTLIDNETGIRTSLSALDYTVFLEAGTYDGRFVMEISPIYTTPTGVENTGDGLPVTGTRKVIIDQNMYIIKNGKMFDARGAVVK